MYCWFIANSKRQHSSTSPDRIYFSTTRSIKRYLITGEEMNMTKQKIKTFFKEMLYAIEDFIKSLFGTLQGLMLILSLIAFILSVLLAIDVI